MADSRVERKLALMKVEASLKGFFFLFLRRKMLFDFFLLKFSLFIFQPFDVTVSFEVDSVAFVICNQSAIIACNPSTHYILELI